MNDFQLFMNFGAVVEIRRNYRDDLYNFVKLMLNLGFMNEEITYFINAMGLLEEFKDNKWQKIKVANNLAIADKIQLLDEWFTDENFWHIIELNNGIRNRICIEYQIGKGFTFGDKEDYLKYDETIKILSVEDLIRACNQAEQFNLDYIETSFLEELKDKKDEELAILLTDFCEWYEWELVKYSNGLYNLLDLQTEELDTDKNYTKEEVIKRVYERLVDYSFDEQEYETYEEVKRDIEQFIRVGKQHNLINEDDIIHYNRILEERKEDFEEN